jgi:hypothetical protein
LTTFVKERPFGQNFIDRCDVYRVITADHTGGTLKGIMAPFRQIFFDVKYTTFNGVSMKVQRLDEIINLGDFVVIQQKFQFYHPNGSVEWRVMDMRYPNTLDPDEDRYSNITESDVTVWVTHGRIMHATMHHATRQDLVISTGFGDNNVFAIKESCFGDLDSFEQNVTVMFRAELKKGSKHQAANFKWFGVNVQVVGELKSGEGLLKQINLGSRRPFVIIANKFGYVMVPKEAQKACAKFLEDGARVTFEACSNLPCHQVDRSKRSLHRWRAVNFSGVKVKGGEEGTSETVQVLPSVLPCSNMSIATTCFSCQGELVCICY